jgi:hypothetical protein
MIQPWPYFVPLASAIPAEPWLGVPLMMLLKIVLNLP